MGGADVLEIVIVHVGVHRDPFEVKGLVILGAGQRSEEKELEDVERQFLLDDLDVAGDRLRGVCGEAEDIARPGHHLRPPPGLQHDAVFPDLVLTFLRALERLGIDVLEPDEDGVAARARRLLDEPRNLVAQRVDLQDQPDLEALAAQLDQPVENRLPVAVAREIVVGDEIVRNALSRIGAHDRLDVVRGAVARLAALDVDDGAEAALERAAAAGVEARVMADDPRHHLARQHGHRGGGHVRHVGEIIVDGLGRAGVNVAQEFADPSLALARVQNRAERLRLFQIRRQFGKHGNAAGDMKSADHDGHALSPKRAREVEGAGKLVGLDPDQPDESPARRPYATSRRAHVDNRVALVISLDCDVDVGAERALSGASGDEAIDAREAVGGNGRAAPLDDVAVVVVVRRLDENDPERPRSHGALGSRAARAPIHRRRLRVSRPRPLPPRAPGILPVLIGGSRYL